MERTQEANKTRDILEEILLQRLNDGVSPFKVLDAYLDLVLFSYRSSFSQREEASNE